MSKFTIHHDETPDSFGQIHFNAYIDDTHIGQTAINIDKLKEKHGDKSVNETVKYFTEKGLSINDIFEAYIKMPDLYLMSNMFDSERYDEIKDKIKDATGIFSSAGPISVTRLEREKEMGIKSSESMEAEHPIVKTVNGKKTLYVSPGHLMKIKNVKEEEADYLKNYLIEHVNKQEFIFSYEWSKGDICLWDNLSILHMASEIKNCKRIMHRITIK